MRRLLLPLLPLVAVALLAPAARGDDDPNNPTSGDRKLSEWMALLRESDNGRIRKAAVVSIGDIATENATNAKLVKDIVVAVGKAMRSDAAVGVREEAARQLARLASDLLKAKGADVGSVVQDLGEGLRTEKEATVRLEQARALELYGPQAKGAVGALTAVLGDADPRVQAAAATALGRIGKEAKTALDALLPLAKSETADVRRWAVFAIGRVEPDDTAKASEAIAKFTTDADEQMRKEAISSLGLLADKSPDTVKAVAAALADKSVEVRRLAAATLGRFERGAKEAEAELLAAFKKDGEDKLVKAYALHSLCVGMKDDVGKILPALTARLDPTVEKEADVRIAICDEIGDMGPDAQPAVPQLRLAQKDPELKVRDAATFAIKKVTAKKEDKPEEKKDK